MKTGIWGRKGHIHYEAAPCINDWLDTLEADSIPRTDIYRLVAEHIDREIHRAYRIYPANRAALAELEGGSACEPAFSKYLDEKLALVRLDKPDVPFLRERMLTMYANPLRNYNKATAADVK